MHPKAVRLVCDFHWAQAQDRWISKNSTGIPAELKNEVSAKLKQLAYTSTGTNTVMLRIRRDYLTEVSGHTTVYQHSSMVHYQTQIVTILRVGVAELQTSKFVIFLG